MKDFRVLTRMVLALPVLALHHHDGGPTVLTQTVQGPTPWIKDTVSGLWLDSSVCPPEAATVHALPTTGLVNPVLVGHPHGIRSQKSTGSPSKTNAPNVNGP